MDKLQAQEYLTQGMTLSGQGKYEEALAYYEKAEREDQMNIEVYLSKGITYANLDRLDDAKAQFGKALKINRTSGLAYFHLGSIALLQGDVAAGFENYNKAVANGYDDAQLYYSMGLLYEEKGESDMAVRNYSKAISRDPQRPDIRIRKARLLLEGNHIPEALQTLDETILTNPDVFEGYHIKFNVLLQMKQYAQAEELLKSALKLFPADPGFLIDRVMLLVAQKKPEEAMTELDALEHMEDTDDALLRRVYMERAQIYAGQDNVDKAVAELLRAQALAEKAGEFDTEVSFLLACCYVGGEQYEKLLAEARALLEKGADGYNKETARYYEPLALKMLGKMDEAKPKYQEAISEYRRQSLNAPGNLDAYLLRTMCLRDLEEYEKALELIDYVVTLQPDRAEPRLLRVTLLEALGQEEDAKNEAAAVNAMLPPELRRK